MANGKRSDWLRWHSSYEMSHSLRPGGQIIEGVVGGRVFPLLLFSPAATTQQCSPKFMPILRSVVEILNCDRADDMLTSILVLSPPLEP
jgi:hypothetical protein